LAEILIFSLKAYRTLEGKPEGKRPLDQDVGGWIILKMISERYDGVVLTGLIWLRIATSGGAFVNTVMNLQVP
jgi:hypothetical protein